MHQSCKHRNLSYQNTEESAHDSLQCCRDKIMLHNQRFMYFVLATRTRKKMQTSRKVETDSCPIEEGSEQSKAQSTF